MKMDGKPFQVRTVIYETYKQKAKQTLLMTHGYGLSIALFFKVIRPLGDHFRLVLVDNSSWGLNTRVEGLSKHLETPEASERYCLTWWENLIEALGKDLPQKFFFTGHSAGGYQAMLYASHHPDRILGLFLMSPACSEPFDKTYDPYTQRLSDLVNEYPSKEMVD